MRTLSGILLGILLTVAIAYASDSMYAGTDAAGVVHRPMVNWDVVGQNVQSWTEQVRAAFDRLRGAPQNT